MGRQGKVKVTTGTRGRPQGTNSDRQDSGRPSQRATEPQPAALFPLNHGRGASGKKWKGNQLGRAGRTDRLGAAERALADGGHTNRCRATQRQAGTQASQRVVRGMARHRGCGERDPPSVRSVPAVTATTRGMAWPTLVCGWWLRTWYSGRRGPRQEPQQLVQQCISQLLLCHLVP